MEGLFVIIASGSLPFVVYKIHFSFFVIKKRTKGGRLIKEYGAYLFSIPVVQYQTI